MIFCQELECCSIMAPRLLYIIPGFNDGKHPKPDGKFLVKIIFFIVNTMSRTHKKKKSLSDVAKLQPNGKNMSSISATRSQIMGH